MPFPVREGNAPAPFRPVSLFSASGRDGKLEFVTQIRRRYRRPAAVLERHGHAALTRLTAFVRTGRRQALGSAMEGADQASYRRSPALRSASGGAVRPVWRSARCRASARRSIAIDLVVDLVRTESRSPPHTDWLRGMQCVRQLLEAQPRDCRHSGADDQRLARAERRQERQQAARGIGHRGADDFLIVFVAEPHGKHGRALRDQASDRADAAAASPAPERRHACGLPWRCATVPRAPRRKPTSRSALA